MTKATFSMTGLALVLAMAAGGAALAHGQRGGDGPVAGPRAAGVETLFERFDSDGDGRITTEEVATARAARFAAADADGDGFLTAEEMTAHARQMREARAAERRAARQAAVIERLDSDGDGKLSAEEVARAGAGAGFFERMLERLDADDDGALSEAELQDARAFRGHRDGQGFGHGGYGHRDGRHGGHMRGGAGAEHRHGAPWWMTDR